MCVILYKKAGAKLPSEKLINQMKRLNHDGFGLCTPKCSFKTMSFDDFKKVLYMQNESEPLLIHFRLATHGSKCQSNCHPFYDAASGTYFMHNGILSVKPYNDMTDSETAFRDYFAPVLKHFSIKSRTFEKIVMSYQGYSKFAFMQNGKVKLFGQWERYQGFYFSNLRFLPYNLAI